MADLVNAAQTFFGQQVGGRFVHAPSEGQERIGRSATKTLAMPLSNLKRGPRQRTTHWPISQTYDALLSKSRIANLRRDPTLFPASSRNSRSCPLTALINWHLSLAASRIKGPDCEVASRQGASFVAINRFERCRRIRQDG